MNATIDLYTFGTGNGWRAAIALEECGLAYRIHKVDIARGEQNAPAFRQINPAGKIPVIIDPDGPDGGPVTLSESGAILLYCAEKTGRFIPESAADRFAALRWVFHAASDASEPVAAHFRLARVAGAQTAIDYYHDRLRSILRDADSHLAGSACLVGDDVTVADLAFYSVAALGSSIVGLNGMDHLQHWFETMSARPGITRGMAVPG